MRLSHNVKHAIIALDDRSRKSHDAPMRLSEVTPDWIARQRDALGLRDADIYRAIGMSQDKFSKSMRGKRAFTPAELDAIVNFLSGEQAAARVPVLAEIVARFPRLSREQQELVANVVDNLWRSAQEARQSDKEPPEDA